MKNKYMLCYGVFYRGPNSDRVRIPQPLCRIHSKRDGAALDWWLLLHKRVGYLMLPVQY